jgi:hypothetical protein
MTRHPTLLLAAVTLAALACEGPRPKPAEGPTRTDRRTSTEGPTLEQTRTWIAAHFPALANSSATYLPGGYMSGASYIRVEAASLDTACTLRMETQYDAVRTVDRTPIRDEDPTSDQVLRQETMGTQPSTPYFQVQFRIADDRRLVESIAKPGMTANGRRKAVDTTFYSANSIPAHDQPSAERLAAALRRAVELCGGRRGEGF